MIIMGRFNYAFQNYDPTRHVRSSLREKDISHKHAREVAISIKGLSIEKARDYLQDVINKKRAVAFTILNLSKSIPLYSAFDSKLSKTLMNSFAVFCG